jgi:hypothetical protein
MLVLLAAIFGFVGLGLRTSEVRPGTYVRIGAIAFAIPLAYLVAPWLR